MLQPNIRLTGAAYWDFIDHKVALTERSLVEAAELCGFETERLIKRFLPYTTKSRLPQAGRSSVRISHSVRSGCCSESRRCTLDAVGEAEDSESSETLDAKQSILVGYGLAAA